ncbi:hypothetical protein P3T37_005175 [Kitasatospora sp. MAA4]|uniref:DUF3574 domain-containing protein n=1 Tax=Kitasatospora sp. MAA4 TaxID=3035093 RepID=UPI002476949E|nr:DUF3574 domain-containing protein [Kitasatospora sp. MAA4]MDH6135758.1 hypothetical protein [Kitasatospora sp. MAA4]
MDNKTRIGLLTGCSLLACGAVLVPAFAATADRPDAPRDAYTRTELYFGTDRPGGGPAVTDQEFQAFLDNQVTPQFPDGLTVQEGRGQYRDRFGVIERERSYQVVLVYPRGTAAAADTSIEAIRRQYDSSFQQESVGRVDEPVRASFG